MSNDGSLDYIYLQPAELACPTHGRLWCEDDDPSGEDGPWILYIRADIHQRQIERLERELEKANEWNERHKTRIRKLATSNTDLKKLNKILRRKLKREVSDD